MLTLSPAAIAEKNKIASTGAWLILLQIDFIGQPSIRLAYNTEDINWPSSGGAVYQAFPFELTEIKEDGKGGLPTFAINVANTTRALEPYVEASNGGKGATVTLRVVHSDHLDQTTPELEETFDNLGCTVSSQWVSFKLGAENPMRRRSPEDRYLKDHCRYGKVHGGFKGPYCGYAGAEAQCNRTFARCKELGNVARFGGFPGIDGGVYV